MRSSLAENRLNLAAYRLVADTERLRRGFQRSSCNEVNNKACLCRGQIEPLLEKCHSDLAAHEGAPFAAQRLRCSSPVTSSQRRKVLDIRRVFKRCEEWGLSIHGSICTDAAFVARLICTTAALRCAGPTLE